MRLCPCKRCVEPATTEIEVENEDNKVVLCVVMCDKHSEIFWELMGDADGS